MNSRFPSEGFLAACPNYTRYQMVRQGLEGIASERCIDTFLRSPDGRTLAYRLATTRNEKIVQRTRELAESWRYRILRYDPAWKGI